MRTIAHGTLVSCVQFGLPVRTTFGALVGATIGAVLLRGRGIGRFGWFGGGMGAGVTWVRVQDAYRLHGPNATASSSSNNDNTAQTPTTTAKTDPSSTSAEV